MRKKKPFNAVERKLQQIPTWAFVSYCVVCLTFVAFWIQPEENLDSPRDLLRVAFYNAESIAIAAAVALYFKEIPDRKEKRHYQAWQVIDNAVGVETSYARYKALQDLNQDGVTLAGIDLPRADLRNIQLCNAELSRANLQGADLKGANLTGANLTEADLRGVNLTNTHLNRVNFSEANLNGAIVSDAALSKTKLCRTILPQGSQLDPNRDCPRK